VSNLILQPFIPLLKSFPKGNDTAAIYPNGFQLSYWDLWFLITLKQKFNFDFRAIENHFVDKILSKNHWSIHHRDSFKDLHAHLKDLMDRIRKGPTPEEILATLPEKLLKKESQKALKNVYEGGGYSHPLSEAMESSPRRLLKEDAMRGEWPRLPVDPTPIANDLFIYYQPPKHYFTLQQTFSLNRRLEKTVNRALKSSSPLFHNEAYAYAVYRAAMTLFNEENNWDDSCGVMGDLFQDWLDKLLEMTPQTTNANPDVFLKDLLLFCCWEDHGCVEEQKLKIYMSQLSNQENEIAKSILGMTHQRAKEAFEEYQADKIKKLGQIIWPGWNEKPKLKQVESEQDK